MIKNLLLSFLIVFSFLLIIQIWIPIPIPGIEVNETRLVDFHIECRDGRNKKLIPNAGVYDFFKEIQRINNGKTQIELRAVDGRLVLHRFRLKKTLSKSQETLQLNVSAPGYESIRIILQRKNVWLDFPNKIELEILKKEIRTFEDRSFILRESVYFPGEEFWLVSLEQAEQALIKIMPLINDPSRNGWEEFGPNPRSYIEDQLESIRINWKKYRVQFLGLVKDGRKIILCNFTIRPTKDNSKYQKEMIMFDDGGYTQWQIEYDPETGKFENFRCNGEA